MRKVSCSVKEVTRFEVIVCEGDGSGASVGTLAVCDTREAAERIAAALTGPTFSKEERELILQHALDAALQSASKFVSPVDAALGVVEAAAKAASRLSPAAGV